MEGGVEGVKRLWGVEVAVTVGMWELLWHCHGDGVCCVFPTSLAHFPLAKMSTPLP